ncbi:MAG: hypothetical protein ACP5I8_15855 [Phycisphaerae bacterium]
MSKKPTIDTETGEVLVEPTAFSPEVLAQIVEWKERYMAEFQKTRQSARLTADPDFQRVVSEFRLRVAIRRRDITERLRIATETSEQTGLTETDEKFIKEIAKDSADLRARESAFEMDTISPVRQRAYAPAEMIQGFKSKALSKDSDFPLGQTTGNLFARALELSAERWPKSSWDAEKTLIVIVEP